MLDAGLVCGLKKKPVNILKFLRKEGGKLQDDQNIP